MKTIVFTICILFSTITMTAQDAISGVYDIGQGNTKVEIKGSEGKVVSSDKLEKGMVMLKDIKSSDGEWKAKLFNAKKNKWYDAVLKEEKNILFVTVKAGFVTKTIEWSKE